MNKYLPLALLLATRSLGATPGTMTCTDLAGAVQANTCPGEAALKFTHNGFYSDTAC